MPAIATLPIEAWDAPLSPEQRAEAIAALEGGQVLAMPRLPFALSRDEEKLLAAVTADGRSKNVSYDPKTGTCKGVVLADEATGARLAAILRRFGEGAQALLLELAPGYARGLERARTSFRPVEVAARPLPWRKDDRRLHVDAFPSRPSHGRRILRVFSNVDPAGGPRRWRVGEPFEQHAARFLPRVSMPLPGQSAVMALLGITRGRRSRYDHVMLGLHDAAKEDAAYQSDAAKSDATATPLEFPAGTSWMVYTDQVPHAALGGRWAFEQTFHLDPAAMVDPAQAPLAVLQRLTGRALV